MTTPEVSIPTVALAEMMYLLEALNAQIGMTNRQRAMYLVLRHRLRGIVVDTKEMA